MSDSLILRSDETADVVDSTNEVRDHVVRTLAGYIELSATMREFEDAFSTQVLHKAHRLHELIEERRRLEGECERIRKTIERGGYSRAEELENDVRAVLAPPGDEDEAGGGPPIADRPPADLDDDLDAAMKEGIVRAFKHVVLPRVHADTSDTPYSIFEVAYSAYKSQDYVIMEAFVIQYRGAVGPSGKSGVLLTRAQLVSRLAEYRAAAQRLDARYQALRRNTTEEELRAPEQTLLRMRGQNEKFRQAILAENERLRELRLRLQALAEGTVR
ncbi:hypothetical protein ITP53_02085 [Nonomuraea sp. K274]|uniref:Uncharacterized protein n=1 Tax=Nonomuraea cypriaca TaxID=1187855 RepID=A0A931A4C0_9ACTN|nr:hypothetical protein [Nonomuraea cypriaca]MBF8184554.1 hypothetical protein [Nonomuraea cypriaca]